MELNEDKILDFLDGSLTSAEEEELLHRLAVSPERRVVLKQHLQLRELSSILAKKHNYVVPKVLTAQLFTSLSANGYAGPMYHAATDTDTLRSSLETNVGRSAENVVEESRGIRRSSLVFSSVLSFIAGAFLVYLLISSPSQSATGSVAVSGGEASKSAIPVTSNTTEVSSTAVGSKIDGGQTTLAAQDIVAATSVEHIVAASTPSSAKLNGSDRSIDVSTSISSTVITPAETIEREGLQFAINADNQKIARVEHTNTDIRALSAYVIEDVKARNWWQQEMYAAHDNLRGEKGYFGLDVVEDTVPFIKRTMVSLRSGGGKAPGRSEDYTGSLVEVKLSADIGDWLVAKVSCGQFMPYETEALSIGKNADGVRMLKLEPVLQYRSVVGAELGFRANLFGATFEAMGGFLSDLRNGFIPRAGIFTTLMLQENLSLQMGVEGAIYTHDIRPSLVNKQMIFAVENPVLTNAMRETETAGFIGPALELAWHF
jgi:hypothetical protein